MQDHTTNYAIPATKSMQRSQKHLHHTKEKLNDFQEKKTFWNKLFFWKNWSDGNNDLQTIDMMYVSLMFFMTKRCIIRHTHYRCSKLEFSNNILRDQSHHHHQWRNDITLHGNLGKGTKSGKSIARLLTTL